MREDILNYLLKLKSKNYSVAKELPFDVNGTNLVTKNPKKIYVDQEQTQVEPFIVTFDETENRTVSTVTVLFSNDAKQLPNDYETVISYLQDVNKIDPEYKYTEKTSSTKTEFDNDMLVTSVELQFSSY